MQQDDQGVGRVVRCPQPDACDVVAFAMLPQGLEHRVRVGEESRETRVYVDVAGPLGMQHCRRVGDEPGVRCGLRAGLPAACREPRDQLRRPVGGAQHVYVAGHVVLGPQPLRDRDDPFDEQGRQLEFLGDVGDEGMTQ